MVAYAMLANHFLINPFLNVVLERQESLVQFNESIVWINQILGGIILFRKSLLGHENNEGLMGFMETFGHDCMLASLCTSYSAQPY